MKKKFPNILIIIGLIIVLIPIFGSVYKKHQQKMLYEEFQASQTLTDTYDSVGNILVSATEGDPSSETKTDKKAYEGKVLGKIKIPSIKVDMLVVDGAGKADLAMGAGHLPETPMPGQLGNCAIAGHRNYTFGSYFNRLDEVKVGDKISVDYGGTTYNYKVYETLVVLPTDTSVLKQPKDEKMLTLITCTPLRKATHRLIIHAEQV